MWKKVLSVILSILNLACFWITVALWIKIGAWALLYPILYLCGFFWVLDKTKIWDYTEEEKEQQREFTKGKTYLGYDYGYSCEIWRDNVTGEIIEQ